MHMRLGADVHIRSSVPAHTDLHITTLQRVQLCVRPLQQN